MPSQSTPRPLGLWVPPLIRRHGVRRIVAVSSKNLADSSGAGEPVGFRLVVGPVLHAVDKTLYADMRRMEVLLHDSDRDWTVVRPAGLFAADRVSAYRTITGTSRVSSPPPPTWPVRSSPRPAATGRTWEPSSRS